MMSSSKPVGFKLSFAGVKNKNALKPANAPPPKKPRLPLGEDEPEDKTKDVEILGWDTATGGAIDVHGKDKEEGAGPRIIPVLPNRNRRQKKPEPTNTNSSDNTEQYPEPDIQYGLAIVKKAPQNGDKEAENNENGDAKLENTAPVDDGLTEDQRLEKRALYALLNGSSADPEAIIPAQTEEEAFDHDYANAPDAPTLDTYEATPIEGFGAALLRGMGWKDGEEIGRNKGNPLAKPREVKRQPALLGIGAKESAAVGIEFGEWGGGKGKKKEQAYNPVMLKNKVTGELVTEEELKRQIEAQEMVGEKKGRRDGYADGGEEEYERKRERKGKEKRDKERRRDDDYHDSHRKKDRRRDEEYYDPERKREKRRERERRDRDSSRSHDIDDKARRKDHRRNDEYSEDDRRREKRRDCDRNRRERSRSPDTDDRRKRRRSRDYNDERDDRKRRHRDDRHQDSDRENYRKKRY